MTWPQHWQIIGFTRGEVNVPPGSIESSVRRARCRAAGSRDAAFQAKESLAKSPSDNRSYDTHTEIEIAVQVAAEERIIGVDYGPFRDSQSPALGIFPTLAQLQADMPLLKRMGNVSRPYSVTNNFDQIIGLAKQAGIVVQVGETCQ